MGRTLPSANVVFMQEEQKLAAFRKLLSRTDRLALDQLFDSAHKYVIEAAEHKVTMEIRNKVSELQLKHEGRQAPK